MCVWGGGGGGVERPCSVLTLLLLIFAPSVWCFYGCSQMPCVGGVSTLAYKSVDLLPPWSVGLVEVSIEHAQSMQSVVIPSRSDLVLFLSVLET